MLYTTMVLLYRFRVLNTYVSFNRISLTQPPFTADPLICTGSLFTSYLNFIDSMSSDTDVITDKIY